MIRVCFVCLGNICRSPTAEGIMLSLVADAGLTDQVEIDSAGTDGHHIGERADPRSRACANERGLNLPSRARRFEAVELDRFDYVLAMDRENLSRLRRHAKTDEQRARLFLLRDFDATAEPSSEVPDPYYGGSSGFDDVFDICERACRGLLDHLRSRDRND